MHCTRSKVAAEEDRSAVAVQTQTRYKDREVHTVSDWTIPGGGPSRDHICTYAVRHMLVLTPNSQSDITSSKPTPIQSTKIT